jgi:hypothetical protein
LALKACEAANRLKAQRLQWERDGAFGYLPWEVSRKEVIAHRCVTRNYPVSLFPLYLTTLLMPVLLMV